MEQFDGSSRLAQRILVAVLLILAAGLAAVGALAPDEDVSAAVQWWISLSLAALFKAASWMFGRMRLELAIDEHGFAARVRPFRSMWVDADSVEHVELVQLDIGARERRTCRLALLSAHAQHLIKTLQPGLASSPRATSRWVVGFWVAERVHLLGGSSA